MATKAEIINKVNTDLASNSNIQAVSHRGVLHGSDESIIDNFYGIKSYDENNAVNTTSNIVTFEDENLHYSVFITKTGTRVNINGFIFNNKTIITSVGSVFFTITNPDYLIENNFGGDNYTVNTLGFNPSGLEFVSSLTRISLGGSVNSNKLTISDPIPQDEGVSFSITYNTAN